MSRYTCKLCGSPDVFIRMIKIELHPIQAHKPDENDSGQSVEGVTTFLGGPHDESETWDSFLFCAECNDDDLKQDEIETSEGDEITTETPERFEVSYSH